MGFLTGFSLATFIKAVGLVGVFLIVFGESGLLIGFFLPGDSLLFTAGFLASQGYVDIGVLIMVAFLAAVVGDSVGYTLGQRFGPGIFRRNDSRFFNQENIERSRRFYERHGGKTVILARFLPVVRTVAPILAGVGRMPYGIFLFYNILGGLLWTVGLSLLGYFLGAATPNIDQYLIPIVIGIILLSILPSLVHILGDHGRRQRFIQFVHRGRK